MLVRFVACFVLLALLCSCVTKNWYTPASSTPHLLPNEIAFTDLNGTAGRGGNLFLTLRLEDGQELAFMIDTGSPVTVLDKSLAPKLGERVAPGEAFFPLHERREPAGIYRAPAIYLGNTRLLTGRWVITEDLAAMTGGPLGGILGMDCLRFYSVQLDFAQNTLRFLDPNAPRAPDLGRPFAMIFSESGPLEVSVPGDFFGAASGTLQIDTGDPWDGAATSNLLHQAVQVHTADWSKPVDPAGRYKAHFPQVTFAGLTYTDVVLHAHARNNIGLRFLARHLVTLDFPQRTMYLKRTSVGPLPPTRSGARAEPDDNIRR
jgi:aspartyl protease